LPLITMFSVLCLEWEDWRTQIERVGLLFYYTVFIILTQY
jgi:hypothetical protein